MRRSPTDQSVPRHALFLVILTAGTLASSACTPNQVQPNVAQATPTVTATATVTTTASPDPALQSPALTDIPSLTDTPSSPPEPSITSVDLEQYRGQDRNDGYFFVSPSGNLACGILHSGVTGCQAWSLVANLPECDNPLGNSSPAIEFARGQRATGFCLTDGAFVGSSRTLEYDTQIRASGFTCVSQTTGVTCIDDLTGLGFIAARAGFIPID